MRLSLEVFGEFSETAADVRKRHPSGELPRCALPRYGSQPPSPPPASAARYFLTIKCSLSGFLRRPTCLRRAAGRSSLVNPKTHAAEQAGKVVKHKEMSLRSELAKLVSNRSS